MDLVDFWPLLEISDWPQNCCNLNRMLIQKKCCSSIGKWQGHLVPTTCPVIWGDQNNYSTTPVQVEFKSDSLQMVKARQWAKMSFSSSIQSVCPNKSEGVDNLVGNKMFILAGEYRCLLSRFPVDTRSQREYWYPYKTSYQLFRVSMYK